MSQGAPPLEDIPLCRGTVAVKVLGYGAHRLWFSREQETLQTVQLREKEREKEVSQSFHIFNLCFCIVQEKAHFKKASQWTKIFLLKNK